LNQHVEKTFLNNKVNFFNDQKNFLESKLSEGTKTYNESEHSQKKSLARFLFRLIQIVLSKQIHNTFNIITRSYNAKKLRRQIKRIHSIETEISDQHNFGQTAAYIFCEDGKILVYKPRCASNEKLVDDIITGLLNSDAGKRLVIYSEKKYSFLRYVDTKKEKLDATFYYNLGLILPFLNRIGLSDLHNENILFENNVPKFIDAECIFQNFSPAILFLKKENIFSKTSYLRHSLTDTGIFPIFSNKDSNLKYLLNYGLDFKIKNKSDLKIKLWHECEKQLFEGLKDANKLWEVKIKDIELSVEKAIKNIEIRVCMLSTYIYVQIIKLITDPCHAINQDLYNKLFTILFDSRDGYKVKGIPIIDIAQSEMQALLVYDVPAYKFKLSKKDAKNFLNRFKSVNRITKNNHIKLLILELNIILKTFTKIKK
jgi:hypothetical protein